jgi:hypothetical protein
MLMLISSSVNADCYDVTVVAQPRKQDGKQWDLGIGDTKPNLSLCIHDSLGYRCKLDSSNPKHHKSLCGDAFHCTFRSVYLPDTRFTAEILDLDQKTSDQVGMVQCDRGVTCPVGVSEVTFKKAKCVIPVE